MSLDLEKKIDYLKERLEGLSALVSPVYAAGVTDAIVDSIRVLEKQIKEGKRLTRGRKRINHDEKKELYYSFIESLKEIESELYREFGLTIKLRLKTTVVRGAEFNYNYHMGKSVRTLGPRFVPKSHYQNDVFLNIEETGGYVDEYVSSWALSRVPETTTYSGNSHNTGKVPIKNGVIHYDTMTGLTTKVKRVFDAPPHIIIPYNTKKQRTIDRYPRLSEKSGVDMTSVVFHMPCQIQVFNTKLILAHSVNEQNWQEKLGELSSKAIHALVIKGKAL